MSALRKTPRKKLPPLRVTRTGPTPVRSSRNKWSNPADAAEVLIRVEAMIIESLGAKVRTIGGRLAESLLLSELDDGRSADMTNVQFKRTRNVRVLRESLLGPILEAQGSDLKVKERALVATALCDPRYFAHRTERSLLLGLDQTFHGLTLVGLGARRDEEAASREVDVEAFNAIPKDDANRKVLAKRTTYGRIVIAIEERVAAVESFRGNFDKQFSAFAPTDEELSSGFSEYLLRGDKALRSYAKNEQSIETRPVELAL